VKNEHKEKSISKLKDEQRKEQKSL
jgi:hypothetical protein